LRWGAWYPVVALTPRHAQVWVHGRALTVERGLIELRATPPREWTVIAPAGARDPHLVCPGCRFRMPAPDRPVASARCPRCNELFTVAWGQLAAPAARDELRLDRRRGRLRAAADRRSRAERRGRPRPGAPRRSGRERRKLDRRGKPPSR
jgi:hypothetical protein